ncbi:MAG TPA: alpha/beta hydrolase [Solirubrobacterales bacterium]|nr:alpha/beta hydrolase [Solirubrobacterales bacterium]
MSTTVSAEAAKQEIELTAGRIRYREAGEGPALVFVHGYLVDGRLWDQVVDALADRFRCIAPDLPFGAHRIPMSPAADLSPTGMAAIVAELIERLELDDVTLVGNDSGGAVSQVLVTTRPAHVGRLVLTNCDTHENFPPGIFKALPPLAKLPGSTWLMLQPMRIKALSRFSFAPFSKAMPAEYVAAWSAGPFSSAGVRRDLGKVTVGMSKRYTLAAAEALRGSQLPILLAWAPGDRFFPMRYPERLASEAGNARIVEIEGSRTFVPLDQPARLAAEIAQFAGTA